MLPYELCNTETAMSIYIYSGIKAFQMIDDT